MNVKLFKYGWIEVGTCESFFFVRIESRIGRPIRFRIDSSNRIGRIPRKPFHSLMDCRPTVQPEHLQIPSVFCICDEREWCRDYGTPKGVLVYFNSVIKRVKQCWCTLMLLPKSTLNANLTTTDSFFTSLRMTIDSADDSKISNRTINTNRISNRTYDSKSNQITKLRRSLISPPHTTQITNNIMSQRDWTLMLKLTLPYKY